MSTIAQPVGHEFLVNTEIASDQHTGVVTGLTNGGFVVCWIDNGGTSGDSAGWGIKAQIFDAKGARVSNEFLVNTQTENDQIVGNVVALAQGGFVVTWTDYSNGSAVKAQIFDDNGVKVGAEFLVNAGDLSYQHNPDISPISSGGFVVSWEDTNRETINTDIKARVFDAQGFAVSDELVVNTVTVGQQHGSAIAQLGNGAFLVTWHDTSQTMGDKDGSGIKAQMFAADGTKLGNEFLVNTQTMGSQAIPAVTGLANGGFVVSWNDDSGTMDDNDRSSVKAQVFAADGRRIGYEFLVNSHTTSDQFAPVIAGLTDGGFVVSWQDYSGTLGDNSSASVKAQMFDPIGTRIGAEFLVNTQTLGGQGFPAASGLTNGTFVVSWIDSSRTLGDYDGWSVKAQIFKIAIAGTAGNDIIVGTTGNDTLIGLAGDDMLDGGLGIDTAEYVGAAKAVKVDLSTNGIQNTLGDGKDTLIGIENLIGSIFADVLRGDAGKNDLDGSAGNDKLYGRGGDDHLWGGEGNDLLDGGIGADVMAGGIGNDTYYVDDVGDEVVESSVIEYGTGKDIGGTDWVQASIDHALTGHVEKLTLAAGAGNLSGTGNDLNNIIYGNDGNNVLNGGLGKDTLTGGAGEDSFVFDVRTTSALSDIVRDFESGVDQIILSTDAFTALGDFGPGALSVGELAYGSRATTADQHLIYNSATGALFYDVDGRGGVVQVQIAVLAAHPVLTASDIVLI